MADLAGTAYAILFTAVVVALVVGASLGLASLWVWSSG